MSQAGVIAPQISTTNPGHLSDGTRIPADLRVLIIASQWHTEIMDALIAGAQRAVADSSLQATVLRVPGSFELTVAAQRAAHSDYDVIIALGVVVRGGTPHFEYVCEAATLGLNEVARSTGKPVGFGLLTCDTEQQAIDRSGVPGASEDKGYEATEAAIATAVRLLALGL